MSYIKTVVLLAVLAAITFITASAQGSPWTSWDKKQVEKILNESPWGQTQTETDTSQMTFKPTSDPRGMDRTRDPDPRNDDPILKEGAKNASIDLKYRIRLFSARPVREAFARLIIMGNPQIKPEQLKGFVEEDYSGWIVVAVAAESADRRYLGPVGQKFSSATAATLKNTVYVERGDGKRVFLAEYAPPGSDGTGAKFFFPKIEEGGRPWLSPSDTLRFVADFGGGIKISWRFKVSDMNYNGTLEY